MSLIGKYPCLNVSMPPTAVSVTSAVVSSLLSVPAIAGNILVVLAIAIDPNRNLRSPFSFLVANLATADLIIGCIVEPMSVEFFVREARGSGSIKTRDTVRRFCYFATCTASLLSLGALTYERFLAITFPMQYRAKLNPKRTALVSLVIWVVSILFPIIYLKVGYLKYYFVFTNTAVIATFLVLVLTYVKVFKIFRTEVKLWDELHDSTAENKAQKEVIKWEKKITKTFLTMLALFIACYLPSLVIIYIISFCHNCDCTFIHWARDINYALIMANSSMNPFVFAWRLENYRKAFVRILRCSAWSQRMRSVSESMMSLKEQINISLSILGITSTTTADAETESTTRDV